VFCNGAEACNQLTQSCECPGTSPCDPESETCDEELNECVPIVDPGCQSDGECDPGQFCWEATGQCLLDYSSTCSPGAGSCQIANPTAGCNSVACCQLVCAFNPACCGVEWTQDCVQASFAYAECSGQ